MITDTDFIQMLDAQADARVNRTNEITRNNEWGEDSSRIPYPFIRLAGEDLELYEQGLQRMSLMESVGSNPGDVIGNLLRGQMTEERPDAIPPNPV